MSNPPKAWADLIKALTILARHPSDEISPLWCSDDTLHVCADPLDFSAAEILRLDELGFFPHDEGGFYSFRFGSA